MCLPVASAMKNKMGMVWRRQEEMTPLQTTSCGQSVALRFATTDIKKEGWVVEFAGKEKQLGKNGVP